MGGIGFNLITGYAIVVTGALAYALGHNITTGKVLRQQLGADAKTTWAKWVAAYKASK